MFFNVPESFNINLRALSRPPSNNPSAERREFLHKQSADFKLLFFSTLIFPSNENTVSRCLFVKR